VSLSLREIFVGVDGGGTHTVALVGRRGDEILGRGGAGPSNPSVVGFEVAAKQIRSAVEAALVDAGVPPLDLLFAGSLAPGQLTLGIAGTGRPSDRARLTATLATELGLPPDTLRIVTDVALLLPAAGVSAGVALVAGTGSSAFGITEDGRTAIAGGWGYLLGDDGSAFDVGRRALRVVLRAVDGLGPPTQLATAVEQHLGVTQPRDLIRVVYQSSSPRSTIADLAPLVVATARDGDPLAQQIVTRAGEKLGQFACAVARRLDLDDRSPVIGTGGLFQAGDLILDPLRKSLARVHLADFRLLDREPAVGALRLASGEVRLEIGG